MRIAIIFMMMLAASETIETVFDGFFASARDALYAAETPKESDELTIMRLKKANLEFALDNVQLQSEILKYKFDRIQADLKRISAELEAKENKK